MPKDRDIGFAIPLSMTIAAAKAAAKKNFETRMMADFEQWFDKELPKNQLLKESIRRSIPGAETHHEKVLRIPPKDYGRARAVFAQYYKRELRDLVAPPLRGTIIDARNDADGKIVLIVERGKGLVEIFTNGEKAE